MNNNKKRPKKLFLIADDMNSVKLQVQYEHEKNQQHFYTPITRFLRKESLS
jgi:hypothetical protein